MITVIRVPRVNANEDYATLVELCVGAGALVEAGVVLAVLETAKSTVTVDAPRRMIVRRFFAEEGSQVAVGATLMLCSDDEDEVLPDEGVEEQTEGVSPEPEQKNAKARLLEKRAARQRTQPNSPVDSVQRVPADELPWVIEFRKKLDENGLSDSLEVYQFGQNDSSAIRTRSAIIEDGAKIGNDVLIEAERVYIGAFAHIGDGTRVVTNELLIGDGAYLGKEVVVDVSGGKGSESRFLVGPECLVCDACYINTSREVVMETESAISRGAEVYTHSFWQSVLDGYHAAFSGVRLCEKSWVGGGCQVLPGVTIGSGSTVMSNSTVVTDIPSHSLAGGVPAGVLRREIRHVLNQREKEQLVLDILTGFSEHLEYRGCRVEQELQSSNSMLRVQVSEVERQTIWYSSENLDRTLVSSGDLVVTWSSETASKFGDDTAVFDLGQKTFQGPLKPLAHELRNYFRRRGIRFKPAAWDRSFQLGLM